MSDEKVEVVSFETTEGTKVTCSAELARRMGYAESKKSTVSKPSSKK